MPKKLDKESLYYDTAKQMQKLLIQNKQNYKKMQHLCKRIGRASNK